MPRLALAALILGLLLAFNASTALAQKPKPPPPTPAPAPVHNTTPPKPTPKPTPSSGSSTYHGYTYYPVVSQLSLNPFSGPPGQPVTVKGKWFYAYEKLTLYWDTRSHVLASVTTDPSGSFSATVKPPDDFVGNHTICLQEASWVPCQVFGLLPRVPTAVQMDPAEGQPGTAILLHGANFDGGQQVVLVLGNKTLQTLVADPNGVVSGQLNIPELSAGSYALCLQPVKPGPHEQPACQQLTVDPVPVAAVTQQSNSLTQFFSYAILLVAVVGAFMFFLAMRRRPADVPNATVEHRVGPPIMTSTHREFWESLGLMRSRPEADSTTSTRTRATS